MDFFSFLTKYKYTLLSCKTHESFHVHTHAHQIGLTKYFSFIPFYRDGTLSDKFDLLFDDHIKDFSRAKKKMIPSPR